MAAMIASGSHAYAGEHRLEGILYDSANPAESMAVVDGQSLKKGDRFHAFMVSEISNREVVLKQADTGEELRLRVEAKPVPAGGTPRTAAVAAPVALPEKTGTRGPAETDVPPILKFWQFWSPLELVSRAAEIKAIFDLAAIYNAGVRYHEDQKDAAREIAQLTQAGYLPAAYEAGPWGAYHFYLSKPGEKFGVHADPRWKGQPMHSFFVSGDAVLRSEQQKPAGPQSPQHRY